MSIDNQIIVALDTSSDAGIVALVSPTRVYYSQCLPEKLSHGQLLCPGLDKALQVLKSEGLVLDGIMVGLGPGSFVGLRIALATALGFSFGRSLPLMGFCSHRALACSVAASSGEISVATKASGDLCYFSNFGAKPGPPEVVHQQDILPSLAPGSLLVTNLHFEQADPADQINIVQVHGPSALGMQKALTHRLSEAGRLVDESDYIKPNYVKAPNVSIPRQSPARRVQIIL